MQYTRFAIWMLICFCSPNIAAAEEHRRLPVEEYVDKMKGGWIGQMAGVGWGGPTEFRCQGRIMAANGVPKWRPQMINQFGQDDIYVEMTFLRTLETHGLDCTIRQAGVDFANSGYGLAHANQVGRDNLRRGIAPPDSGHPHFTKHADDIDYQIEADYSGLIAPGMPQLTIELGEKFGRLMNYGDGLYGGQFVGGMYAEAFFEDDIVRIVEAGLRCIPKESQYAEMVRDMLAWYRKNPDNWQKTWQWCEDKYHKNARYTHGLCSRPGGVNAFSIDAKLNGAYIIMGLLYGKRDPDKTIIISTRCGQDSDCNPSNAGGVLFTTIGFKKLPERFVSALNPKARFSHTPYDFPRLSRVCEVLARKAVVAQGGRIEKDDKGKEVFVIPVQTPKPGKLEQSWKPRPIAESLFTDAEIARIAGGRSARKEISKAVATFAPGWKVADCSGEMNPGLRKEWGGRKGVLVTHPLSEAIPCVLTKKVDVPTGKTTTLVLGVGHDPHGDWTLVVKIDGKTRAEKKIGKGTCTGGWTAVTVDLSTYAGKSVKLDLENRADGWSWEAGYWSQIVITSE